MLDNNVSHCLTKYTIISMITYYYADNNYIVVNDRTKKQKTKKTPIYVFIHVSVYLIKNVALSLPLYVQ